MFYSSWQWSFGKCSSNPWTCCRTQWPPTVCNCRCCSASFWNGTSSSLIHYSAISVTVPPLLTNHSSYSYILNFPPDYDHKPSKHLESLHSIGSSLCLPLSVAFWLWFAQAAWITMIPWIPALWIASIRVLIWYKDAVWHIIRFSTPHYSLQMPAHKERS